jgi:hypothetical protein
MQLLTTLQDRLPVFCMEPPKDRHLRREDWHGQNAAAA